jgi:hypothetical protein
MEEAQSSSIRPGLYGGPGFSAAAPGIYSPICHPPHWRRYLKSFFEVKEQFGHSKQGLRRIQ